MKIDIPFSQYVYFKDGYYAFGLLPNSYEYLEVPKGYCEELYKVEYPEGAIITNVENLDKMLSKGTYDGRPVIINIKNVSELNVEMIENYRTKCNVQAVQIIDMRNQCECKETMIPYNVEKYIECRKAINKIINNIEVDKPKDTPDYEKRIFGKVLKELSIITYDHEAFRKGKRKIESRNLEGLLSGKTICVGYSEIIRNILACYGIESKLIGGGAHCWNQVKLDNDWYNCDFTFDQPRVARNCNTKYLLKSDKGFKGHDRLIKSYYQIKQEHKDRLNTPPEYDEHNLEQCEKNLSDDEIYQYIYGRERTPKSEILLKLYTKFNIDRDNIAGSKSKLNSILEHVKEFF